MCGPTNQDQTQVRTSHAQPSGKNNVPNGMPSNKVPIEAVAKPPTLLARYACAFAMLAVFAVWGNLVFVPEAGRSQIEMHSWKVPAVLTTSYLLSLPLLRAFSQTFLSTVDVKLLLKETMIVYNGGQVVLNIWMVYKIIEGLLIGGHPFIGDVHTITAGVTYTIWIHYVDKYLEFFDTVFMVLRGRMDQVSFLHVYHHVSIAWAWWYAMCAWPGGDGYFGALLNSMIHVMMYSYYTLSLLKISCPWKRYLTQAQLLQFCTVIVYTFVSSYLHYQQQDLEAVHVWALLIQLFEMTSLFFLFMVFYSKAYNKRPKKTTTTASKADVMDNGKKEM